MMSIAYEEPLDIFVMLVHHESIEINDVIRVHQTIEGVDFVEEFLYRIRAGDLLLDEHRVSHIDFVNKTRHVRVKADVRLPDVAAIQVRHLTD